MFARVSTYRAPDVDHLLEGFRTVTDSLEGIDGFSHAYFLVDRSGGKAMSVTVWKTEEALSASAAKAGQLRETGTQAGGGSIDSVEHFEVGLTVGRNAPVATR